ncbi:MAG: outer membrane protein assembly factor BamE [Nevskiales bacterium]|nr:outer membrane protein assembly factor BamE [Nevskiales bacterium]
MRLLFVLTLSALLAGCNIVYRLPTRQGNVIEQKQLDQLRTGLTREQVVYLMGTPLAASPFQTDRWDYVGYYKSPRGKVSKRIVTLYFDGDLLAKMEGVEPTKGSGALENPDVKTVIRDEKKDATEKERSESESNRESGVILTPDK